MIKKNFIFLFLLSIFSSQISAKQFQLYKEFYFGISKSKIMKIPNIYDCSVKFGRGALCLNNQKFLDENITISFIFIDNKLISIILVTEISTETYLKYMSVLGSKFILASMQSQNDSIDVLEEMNKTFKKAIKNKIDLNWNNFNKKIHSFQQLGLNREDIKYILIDKKSFENMKNPPINTINLYNNSNENLRIVEFTIIKGTDNSTIGLIQFSIPKMILKKIVKNKKYEDF